MQHFHPLSLKQHFHPLSLKLTAQFYELALCFRAVSFPTLKPSFGISHTC
jgi:hypothetical protein